MSDSGHLIRKWRWAQTPRVTLVQLAGDVGASKVSLSRIETGGQSITPAMGVKLSKRTGISVAVLCPKLAEVFADGGEARP